MNEASVYLCRISNDTVCRTTSWARLVYAPSRGGVWDTLLNRLSIWSVMDDTPASMLLLVLRINVVISVSDLVTNSDDIVLTTCSVFMERLYCKRGLPLHRYPLRG